MIVSVEQVKIMMVTASGSFVMEDIEHWTVKILSNLAVVRFLSPGSPLMITVGGVTNPVMTTIGVPHHLTIG